MSRPVLFVTPGDPAGIGPEVSVAGLKRTARTSEIRNSRVVIVGAAEAFPRSFKRVEIAPLPEGANNMAVRAFLCEIDRASRSGVPFISAPLSAADGILREGFQAGWSIETAYRHIALLMSHQISAALVTGPISKDRLRKGGYLFNGHTDFLAALCASTHSGPPRSTMMLANDLLRVSLVTTHLALKDVSRALTIEEISRTIIDTSLGLQKVWQIKRPRIAVAALNPHAGESGLFGDEEITTIAPAIAHSQALAMGATIEGPFPADTLFALPSVAGKTKDSKKIAKYDAVVCMYHDQGLIPVKLLDFANTVNVTLGLPILRTSVDHGTAFDIAGKGVADASSMVAALRLAARAAKNFRTSNP